jgi:hypothetical protein
MGRRLSSKSADRDRGVSQADYELSSQPMVGLQIQPKRTLPREASLERRQSTLGRTNQISALDRADSQSPDPSDAGADPDRTLHRCAPDGKPITRDLFRHPNKPR